MTHILCVVCKPNIAWKDLFLGDLCVSGSSGSCGIYFIFQNCNKGMGEVIEFWLHTKERKLLVIMIKATSAFCHTRKIVLLPDVNVYKTN